MNTFVNEENKMTKYQERTFNDIKHIDEYGNEFWYARELQDVLDYREWRKFEGVITKAKKSCENSKINIEDHFATVDKMVKIRSKTKRKIRDYKLSRYACYLIIQNADPKKEIVALGQTYIALQTRRKELTEKEYSMLIEVEKKFCQKNLTNKENYSLNQVAKEAGVKNFDQFHDAGYRGLYNGETGDDIAKRKGLRYKEEILDNMDPAELGANIFRISQTEALLKKQEEPDENLAT